MGITPRQKAKPHLLMSGHTISAVIKQVNLYDVSKEEMTELLAQYKLINSADVPRPGTRVMVPVLERHQKLVLGTKESPI